MLLFFLNIYLGWYNANCRYLPMRSKFQSSYTSSILVSDV